jgi:hypothetical protein
MGKKYAIFGLMAAMIFNGLPTSLLTAQAAQKNMPGSYDNIPKKDGIYPVPGHPDMQVQVNVYYPQDIQNDSQDKTDNTATSNSTAATDSALSTNYRSQASYCRVSDPGSNLVDPKGNTHLPLGKWTYQLNPSTAPSSVRNNLPSIASASFKPWSSAINGKITFVRGADTTVAQANSDDGINLIAWGSGLPTGALAVTYAAYYSNGTIVSTDTILNNSVPWSWTQYSTYACPKSTAYDVEDILTHELGHWTGLKDTYDTNYANNTMYGYAAMGEIKKDTLTQGDITAVKSIYPN